MPLPSTRYTPTLCTILFVIMAVFSFENAKAQQITGVWKGKINKQRVELKIIQNGDSLTGTSYYYASANNYSRYSIKGYFNPNSNSVIWWDDELIEKKGGLIGTPGKTPQLAEADFNCPGGGEMYLEGKASPKEKKEGEGPVDLTKVDGRSFTDEWDFVIDNYTIGANNPVIIDSVELIAGTPPRQSPAVQPPPPLAKAPKPGMVSIPPPAKQEPVLAKATVPAKPLTIEEKFITRQKVFITEIPITGDSIELRFYDNAEIDGDSISLFLNDKLLFQHIRLTDKPYTIKLPVSTMNRANELTMVAENLGAIPPNTSYMVALVGDKRYEAKLASTENSSAVIRLNKMTD